MILFPGWELVAGIAIVVVGAAIAALVATVARRLALASLVDRDGAVPEKGAIQLGDSGLGLFVIAESDEAKAFAAASFAISDNGGGNDLANLTKEVCKVLVVGLIGETPYVKSHLK